MRTNISFHLDILKRILRMLFVRPAAIMPSEVRIKRPDGQNPAIRYKYQWAEARQYQYEEEEVPWLNDDEDISVAWTCKPTDDETQEIAIYHKLSDIIREGSPNEHRSVHMRKDYGPQVIHRTIFKVSGIHGICLLRTCKRLSALGSSVLYGENIFVFDTRGNPQSKSSLGIHPAHHLTKNTLEIPGAMHESGWPQTKAQTDTAIENMFKPHDFHNAFMSTNPLTRFFNEIGRSNASNITNVVLQGHFLCPSNKKRAEFLSFEQILPIQIVILNDVCKNLKKVTLHDDDRGRSRHPPVNQKRSPYKKEAIDCSDIIDAAVEKLVKGLPMLKELQLGDYHYVPASCGYDIGVPGRTFNPATQPEDEWKSSLQWIKHVEKRTRRQDLGSMVDTESNQSIRKRVRFSL